MGIGDAGSQLVGYANLPGYTGVGSRNDVQVGSNYYIRGVRACTNNSSYRVKGLEIYSAYVDDVEYVSVPIIVDLYIQPNCDYWHPWVTCPEGEVAVAVRMHHVLDAFIGIELQCAEVVWSS
jgi:hypothetical protein